MKALEREYRRWSMYDWNSKKIIRYVICSILGCLICVSAASATNWYVRPSGGSGSGTNWNTAWNGLSSIKWPSVACGDTIWVAGGLYTQDLTPQKSCSSGSRLYIRRARGDATECTSAAGWNASYDSTVEQRLKGILFGNYNYITISGRTTASGGDYGWLINFPGVTSGKGIEWPNGSTGSYITVEYTEVRGPDILGFKNDGRGIDDTPYSSATDHTFSHMKIWGWESGIYVAGTNNHVSEYIDMYHIQSDGVMHPNLYYIINSANGIIRYSRFHDSAASGTGIAFSDGGPWNNWKIYGNLFYNMQNTYGTSLGVQDGAIVGLKIFNNTFVNNNNNMNLSSASCGSGCETRNNIFFGSGGSISCGTVSNNLAISNLPNPFADLNSNDYRIVSTVGTSYPRNAGYNLSSYFTQDMYGTTFGADGSWDIGAYEYGSSPNYPAPPKGLRID
jgi:hypothetical protein